MCCGCRRHRDAADRRCTSVSWTGALVDLDGDQADQSAAPPVRLGVAADWQASDGSPVVDGGSAVTPRINEFVFDHLGADSSEFVELIMP